MDDALAEIQPSPVKDFDQRVAIRAEKHEHMRGRNNVTSCRSPRIEFDTKLIKNELKEKRQLEYLRRRSVSPELCGSKSTRTKTSSKTMKHHSIRRQTNTNIQTVPSNRHKKVIVTSNSSVTDGPSTSTWASFWSEQETPMRQEKDHSNEQASTSTPAIKESNQHMMKRENGVEAPKATIKRVIRTESIYQKFTTPKCPLREVGVQTVSGLITVKESDVQQLAEYLQEALWREETMKKKLAVLQESMSDLINSSNKIWTARCSEDLLRNKIKALEAQLHVCLKFPKDGIKKLVQMEKQKLIYEEKAIVAFQKATQEKMEALSKAETLQELLISAKAEALKWQSLYGELKLSCDQLRENQHLSNEQLQQLLSQVELLRAREDELRDEVVSLRQVNKELQYNICLLEEDSLSSKEEIRNLRDGDNERKDSVMQDRLTSEETETRLRKDDHMEEQLQHTQEKLCLKERECEDLQTELHNLEQECLSSQARLSQCREELRQISHRHRRLTPCGSWRTVCVFLLLLAVIGVAMLWMWHPPFREQIEDLYSDIETRIEDYLLEMATPEHSGCFRPI